MLPRLAGYGTGRNVSCDNDLPGDPAPKSIVRVLFDTADLLSAAFDDLILMDAGNAFVSARIEVPDPHAVDEPRRSPCCSRAWRSWRRGAAPRRRA